ncbi:MAG: vWA domain-containing protein [Bauldia sp.]
MAIRGVFRAMRRLRIAAAAIVLAAAPAAADTPTVLFCVSDASVVRVEFAPGVPQIMLDDVMLPAPPGADPTVPGPFVTRIGDMVMDYELHREGTGWALRTTSVRLPAGTAAASIGTCRTITAGDIAPRMAVAVAAPAPDTRGAPAVPSRTRVEDPSSVAVVYVLDRSGSMSASADGRGLITRLDVAKSATVGAAMLLNSRGRVGIVMFSEAPYILVPIQNRLDVSALEAALRPVVPGGGTNLYPAIEQAVWMLSGVEAPVRHVVIMTDGISAGADFATLLGAARAAGITVSTIGIGVGADDRRLADIADLGGGRFHAVPDIAALPAAMEADLAELLAAVDARPPAIPAAAAGRRSAILYEEGSAGGVGTALDATIAWRLVRDPAGPIIAATIEIPERRMSIAFAIQENHNTALWFSHEVDFLVTVDPAYAHPGGGVASITLLAVKTTEDAVGEPLAGLANALPPDFFWIELDPAAVNQNLLRLDGHEWFDLGIVYANGQRAILTFEKGLDGLLVFQEALAAWAAN